MFITRLIGRFFHKDVTVNTRFPDYRRYRCANHRTHDRTDGCGYEFEHHQGTTWKGPFNSPVPPSFRSYAAMLDDYRECFNNFVDIGPVINAPAGPRTRIRSGRR